MTDAPTFHEHAPDVWYVDGEDVDFYGFPYPTRMTVIRLAGDDLFVHSPIRWTQELDDFLKMFGKVRYIVSPNKIHHLFIGDWKARYPQAEMYASPGLAKKRMDLAFTATLTDEAPAAWSKEIDQAVLKGSFFMEEVAFFHKASRTMIVADMIERLDGARWPWWARIIGRLDGLMGEHGGMPREWRASFIKRKQARADVRRMIDWNPARIIIAHGPIVESDGAAYLASSFHWLLK